MSENYYRKTGVKVNSNKKKKSSNVVIFGVKINKLSLKVMISTLVMLILFIVFVVTYKNKDKVSATTGTTSTEQSIADSTNTDDETETSFVYIEEDTTTAEYETTEAKEYTIDSSALYLSCDFSLDSKFSSENGAYGVYNIGITNVYGKAVEDWYIVIRTNTDDFYVLDYWGMTATYNVTDKTITLKPTSSNSTLAADTTTVAGFTVQAESGFTVEYYTVYVGTKTQSLSPLSLNAFYPTYTTTAATTEADTDEETTETDETETTTTTQAATTTTKPTTTTTLEPTSTTVANDEETTTEPVA